MKKSLFFGKDCLKNLENIFTDYKWIKILLIVGKNSFHSSGAKQKLDKFLSDKKTKILFKNQNYPDLSDLKNIISEINSFRPDVIITLGGGSTIDLGKVSNFLHSENNLIEQIKISKFGNNNKFCKLIAIPTTAGSGAETTSNAVIYIDKVKYSVEDNCILPDFIFIDPELAISVPKKLSASAGIDAMSQAIESLFSLKSNSESVKYALTSLKYSSGNIEKHINNPSFETSNNMCNASFFSGKAINISKTTAPHAISYPFTSFYGINHGHAVSLTLIDFINFNYQNLKIAKTNFDLKERFNLLFEIFNVKNINELSLKISNILKKINLNTNLKDLNIKSISDIDKIVSNINLQRLKNNPIQIDRDFVRELLIKKI